MLLKTSLVMASIATIFLAVSLTHAGQPAASEPATTSRPATPPPTMAFAYHSAALSDILKDLSSQFDITIGTIPTDSKVTLIAPGNLTAPQACALIDEMVKPSGLSLEIIPRTPDAVIKAARLVLLKELPPRSEPVAPEKFAGILNANTMTYRMVDARLDDVLQEISNRFGFIIIGPPLRQRVTIQVPQPVPPAKAVEITGQTLVPLGLKITPRLSASGTRTILWIEPAAGTPLVALKTSDSFHPTTDSASAPIPPGSLDPIEERMAARRAQQGGMPATTLPAK